MRNQIGMFAAVMVLLGAATFGGDKPAAPASAMDACTLVSSAEFQAVQGEGIRATKSNTQSNAQFDVYQCFYTAPTFAKSVALEILRQRQAPGAVSVRNFWQEKFHRAASQKQEEEEEAAKPAKRAAAREEREEEEGAKLQPVAGVGEEAYWAGTGIGAALYVLQGDRILRISIGGPERPEVKMKKAMALAQDALRRM